MFYWVWFLQTTILTGMMVVGVVLGGIAIAERTDSGVGWIFVVAYSILLLFNNVMVIFVWKCFRNRSLNPGV